MKKSKKGILAKFNKAMLYIVVLDILFYSVIGGSIYFADFILLQNFSSLESIYPALEKLGTLSESEVPSQSLMVELEAAKNLMRKIIITSIIVFAGFYIVGVAITSVLKGLIWAKISQQKFSLRFFRKFLLFNYMWFGFWLIVFGLSFMLFKANIKLYIMSVEFLLFLHTGSVIRAGFSEKEKLFRIFRNGIIGCVKLPMLAYVSISFIVFILIGYILFLVLQGTFFVILILILLSVYSVFVRRYLSASLL